MSLTKKLGILFNYYSDVCILTDFVLKRIRQSYRYCQPIIEILKDKNLFSKKEVILDYDVNIETLCYCGEEHEDVRLKSIFKESMSLAILSAICRESIKLSEGRTSRYQEALLRIACNQSFIIGGALMLKVEYFKEIVEDYMFMPIVFSSLLAGIVESLDCRDDEQEDLVFPELNEQEQKSIKENLRFLKELHEKLGGSAKNREIIDILEQQALENNAVNNEESAIIVVEGLKQLYK